MHRNSPYFPSYKHIKIFKFKTNFPFFPVNFGSFQARISDRPVIFHFIMTNVIEFTGDLNALSSKVREHKSLVIMMFYMPTCPACQHAWRVAQTIISENKDVLVLRIDTTGSSVLVKHYNVMNVPQFIFVKGMNALGTPREIAKQIGWDDAKFKAQIAESA